jgi:hypothetical protein
MIAPFIKAVQVGAVEIYNELMLVPPVLKRVLCNSTNFSFQSEIGNFCEAEPGRAARVRRARSRPLAWVAAACRLVKLRDQ